MSLFLNLLNVLSTKTQKRRCKPRCDKATSSLPFAATFGLICSTTFFHIEFVSAQSMNPLYPQWVQLGSKAAWTKFFQSSPEIKVFGQKPCGNSQDCKAFFHRLANKKLHTRSYSKARYAMFQDIDGYMRSGSKVVRTVYTRRAIKLPKNGIPNHRMVNTEHSWPQSQLKKYKRFSQSRADLYHLFPTISKVNNTRASLPFSECKGGNSEEWQVCRSGFEPPNAHKGIVARAMFYMAVTYKMPIKKRQEDTLRRWAQTYPPQQSEVKRAKKIAAIQGNQNPFIHTPDAMTWIADF